MLSPRTALMPGTPSVEWSRCCVPWLSELIHVRLRLISVDARVACASIAPTMNRCMPQETSL